MEAGISAQMTAYKASLGCSDGSNAVFFSRSVRQRTNLSFFMLVTASFLSIRGCLFDCLGASTMLCIASKLEKTSAQSHGTVALEKIQHRDQQRKRVAVKQRDCLG